MTLTSTYTDRYAKCIAASRRINWDIEQDVIRGRALDFTRPFLPDGLSRVSRLDFLSPAQRLRLSHIQGRTYANMFGLVERFIGIKMMELSRMHWYGDQVALEALVRFTDEELKHQELFRRIGLMTGAGMPEGYEFMHTANAVAAQVLGASTWSVLALTCHIELFTQVHYRHSIAPDADICELYKDVFLHHWKEETQHAIIDELEWERENRRVTPAARDRGVDDLVALFGALDGMLQVQARSDARYFAAVTGGGLADEAAGQVERALLDAYRWQYIVSGLQVPRFARTLASMLDGVQLTRIRSALAPMMG